MNTYDFLRNMDRRTFLRIVSVTGTAGLIYPHSVISSFMPTATSRVVIVEDETATSGTSINENTVRVMVDRGIKTLAQQADISDAWKALLPGINETHTIAIKVNCINSSMPTHPQVTYTVVESLKQMVFETNTFPENHIIIFDRTTGELRSCGYTINTSNTGVRCFGTDTSGVGYSSENYDVAGQLKRISKIVTVMANYLINISVLKNHGTSGVTLCLKNHYGTVSNPDKLHGNDCDPYIPALNAVSPIIIKQKLNICDALLGIRSGGPGGPPQFRANKLIMSQDIVAADYQGRKILKDNQCYTISAAHHIDTAATAYGLGINDPAQMEVVNIVNPTSELNISDNGSNLFDGFVLQQNYPNPFNNHTQIRFYIARPVDVNLSVLNIAGRQVRTMINHNLETGWHQIAWDGCNNEGKQVASGTYICRLIAGEFQKSIIMQLMK